MSRSKTISSLLALLQCVALGLALLAASAGPRQAAASAARFDAAHDCVSTSGQNSGDRGKCGRDLCCLLCCSSRAAAHVEFIAILGAQLRLTPPHERTAVAWSDRRRYAEPAPGWASSWSSRGPPSLS
ncbi:hypothetical protein [Methylocystis heyeri]|uniref:DUF2946 domain-containing protein n=1 Tax=Methylocystis heyeri TaxID=391905 RepID=A0A6B8KAB0_9HYPH|nr:hypothetical protein [Methylocystis heyeri]QGM45036.1 hypothetical protein H2LOC_004665 [Methylocystis heyeri]